MMVNLHVLINSIDTSNCEVNIEVNFSYIYNISVIFHFLLVYLLSTMFAVVIKSNFIKEQFYKGKHTQLYGALTKILVILLKCSFLYHKVIIYCVKIPMYVMTITSNNELNNEK